MEPSAAGCNSPTAPILPAGQSVHCRRYLARQPILDRDQKTYGYELLFRSGPDKLFCTGDSETAVQHTIDFSLLLGPAMLTAGRVAFVNCTRSALVADAVTLLPREQVVVELLEDIPADSETLAACQRLVRAGYRIALDDYVPTADTLRLLPYAEIVKVDFLATDTAALASIAADMHRRGVRLLAEKVETRQQYELACSLGYHYFQGYYFFRPETLTTRDVPASQLGYVQVLSLVNREPFDVGELEQAILREPALCYRLLRYLNSAAIGVLPVHSIRHALLLLGQTEIRKWVSVVVTLSLCCGRSEELIYGALVRARCCELLAGELQEDRGGAFMTGILSLLDAVLDCPMETVTAGLPLNTDCRQALVDGGGPLGGLLRAAVWCERADWEPVCDYAGKRGVDETIYLDAHREACLWADQILMHNRGPQ